MYFLMRQPGEWNQFSVRTAGIIVNNNSRDHASLQSIIFNNVEILLEFKDKTTLSFLNRNSTPAEIKN